VGDFVDDSADAHRVTLTYASVKRALAQGLVEYGLIIAFVALLAVASLLLFRPSLPSLLSQLSTSV
jgi:hypothetical protein